MAVLHALLAVVDKVLSGARNLGLSDQEKFYSRQLSAPRGHQSVAESALRLHRCGGSAATGLNKTLTHEVLHLLNPDVVAKETAQRMRQRAGYVHRNRTCYFYLSWSYLYLR